MRKSIRLPKFSPKPKRHNYPVTVIQLRVPAQPEFVGLVRSTTTAVLARTQVSYDDALEWPLAIDEAFALVINHQPSSGDVLIEYQIEDGQVAINLTGPTGSSAADLEKEVCLWGWNILTAAVPNSVFWLTDEGAVSVTLDSRVVASA